MAATKGSSTLQTSTSNAASSTTTSSSLDMSTYYSAVITAQITNGATGPTLACNATVNISPDGTTWYQWAQGTAGVAASTTYPFGWDIPPGVLHAQVVFTGNTGQAVTVAAQAQYISGI